MAKNVVHRSGLGGLPRRGVVSQVKAEFRRKGIYFDQNLFAITLIQALPAQSR